MLDSGAGGRKPPPLNQSKIENPNSKIPFAPAACHTGVGARMLNGDV
jgi:hypothetical protein